MEKSKKSASINILKRTAQNLFRPLRKMWIRNIVAGTVRKVEAINLKKAKTVCIVLNADHFENELQVRKLMNELSEQNIQCSALGYLSHPKTKEERKESDYFRYITREDCSWLGFPPPALQKAYSHSGVDILIDVSLEEEFPLKLIIAGSQAKMKSGIDEVYAEDFLDLRIRLGEKKNFREALEQSIKYLTLINKE